MVRSLTAFCRAAAPGRTTSTSTCPTSRQRWPGSGPWALSRSGSTCRTTAGRKPSCTPRTRMGSSSRSRSSPVPGPAASAPGRVAYPGGRPRSRWSSTGSPTLTPRRGALRAGPRRRGRPPRRAGCRGNSTWPGGGMIRLVRSAGEQLGTIGDLHFTRPGGPLQPRRPPRGPGAGRAARGLHPGPARLGRRAAVAAGCGCQSRRTRRGTRAGWQCEVVEFQHSGAIWRDFPELVAGVVFADGINPAVVTDDRVAKFTTVASARLAGSAESELPEIRAWRRAFARMGLKPTQYRCASEALLRRLRKDGALPQLHPLIDLCNAASRRPSPLRSPFSISAGSTACWR